MNFNKRSGLLFSIVLVSYVCFVTYKAGEYDQFLIGQLLLAILTLTGFKNSFGINKLKKSEEKTIETTIDIQAEPTTKDEGDF